MLNSLITSKTRLRMLIKFFVSAANNGYLNGLATEFNESTNSIRKELNNLSEAGYLLKSKENNRVIYNANTTHPMFEVLQKIVRQHLGLEEIVETVIKSNEKRKYNLADRILNILKNPKGKKVGFLGVTFKANTDDMRDTQCLKIFPKLLILWNINLGKVISKEC